MKKQAIGTLLILTLLVPSKVFASHSVPILIYHSIGEYKGLGNKELYVTPENFEDQMRYLRDHGYTLLTFDRWEDIEKVTKPIFITFDDGYKNNWNVIDIFNKLRDEKFHPTATFFIISDFIGRSNRLSRADLKTIAEQGVISIQSHTATHPDLTKIENYHDELKKSKEKIHQITNKPVIALAYPYGVVNNKVIEETKKYYSFGVTTIPERFQEKGRKDELYLLPRIYIKYSSTLDDFARIVEGERR